MIFSSFGLLKTFEEFKQLKNTRTLLTNIAQIVILE